MPLRAQFLLHGSSCELAKVVTGTGFFLSFFFFGKLCCLFFFFFKLFCAVVFFFPRNNF